MILLCDFICSRQNCYSKSIATENSLNLYYTDSGKAGIQMRNVTVAAIQMHCTSNVSDNIALAESLVEKAANAGAQIILLPELFERTYFCQEENYDFYSYAQSASDNQAVNYFREVAAKLHVVLPISFYERENNELYNSIEIIDADGSDLGTYRKTHIPDDHFYQEKFYFTPGNTGFKVFKTAYAAIGVGICWDQWFPETARIMAVQGAELLLYPTAIGSEPVLSVDSMPHWRRVMQGHSAANLLPVIAANRIGKESVLPSKDNAMQRSSLTFYGSSFITDNTGDIIESCDREEETFISHSFDLDELEKERLSWGLFRDRRPEMYKDICK